MITNSYFDNREAHVDLLKTIVDKERKYIRIGDSVDIADYTLPSRGLATIPIGKYSFKFKDGKTYTVIVISQHLLNISRHS
jgi:hypothetical protein